MGIILIIAAVFVCITIVSKIMDEYAEKRRVMDKIADPAYIGNVKTEEVVYESDDYEVMYNVVPDTSIETVKQKRKVGRPRKSA